MSDKECKKRGNKIGKESYIIYLDGRRGASVETKYHAMESYFNAWNNVNNI